MPAGERKMPDPMVMPTTIATELQQLVASITDHAIFTTDREGRVTGWAVRSDNFAAGG